MSTKLSSVRLIALYLPQFHPIPENDHWWGKGFTEWTNVAKAKPMFKGHYQPHLPADLGFYDLRVSETRVAQAEMASEYGIEGFCYWHYWFAGKRLLERPFNDVLKSGEPDFPFCLAWANQSWTGIWYGTPDRILVEQTYPGMEDYRKHFLAVQDAFFDKRYMTINGMPVFLVWRPHELPEPRKFTDYWRELAIKSGLKGIYFIGISWPSWNPLQNGFDASTPNPLPIILKSLNNSSNGLLYRAQQKLIKKQIIHLGNHTIGKSLNKPVVHPYKDFIRFVDLTLTNSHPQYPTVMPNWDNTPRSGLRGVVIHESSPQLFNNHLRQAIDHVIAREPDQRIVFIKSWNEWAEGNHLEPDQRFGRSYLEVVRESINAAKVRTVEQTESYAQD